MSEETIQRLSRRAASRIRDGFTPESIIADTLNIQHEIDAKAHAAEVEKLTKERDEARKRVASLQVLDEDVKNLRVEVTEHCAIIRGLRTDIERLRRELAAAIAERDEHQAGRKKNFELIQKLLKHNSVLRDDIYTRNAQVLGLQQERDKLRQRVGELETGMEVAWGVIANASKGNWHHESEDWQDAAADWRDSHWHKMLSTKGGDEPCLTNFSNAPSVADTTADLAAQTLCRVSTAPPTSEPEAGATPETDALWDGCQDAKYDSLEHRWKAIAITVCHHSQDLERQRDAALARLAAIESAVSADRLDLEMMRDGTKTTREALVSMIWFQRMDIDELKAKAASDAKEIAELKQLVADYETGLKASDEARKIMGGRIDVLRGVTPDTDSIFNSPPPMWRDGVRNLEHQRDEARVRADQAEAACAAMRSSLTEMLEWFGNPREQEWTSGAMYQAAIAVEKRAKSALATDSGKALLDRLAAAEADTKRLDFVLSILQKHGVMGFLAHAWSNDPSDPTFDRAAIDIALNAMQKGTTNE